MRLYQAASLPKDWVDFLKVNPGDPRVDPDMIYDAVKRSRVQSSSAFILAQTRDGAWVVDKGIGLQLHGDLNLYWELRGNDIEKTDYIKVFGGRTVTFGDTTVVGFWPSKFFVRMQQYPGDSEILAQAIPALKTKGVISPRTNLWVFGFEGSLIQTPQGTPEAGRGETQKSQYQIGSRQYSYIDLARAFHTLPRGSAEFQAIAAFLRSSNAPELAGLKNRLPPEKAQVSESPKWYEFYKPENLESLGSQSRINKYWDARVAPSRRARISNKLCLKLASMS